MSIYHVSTKPIFRVKGRPAAAALLAVACSTTCMATDPEPSAAPASSMAYFRVINRGYGKLATAQTASAATQVEWDVLKRRLEADGAYIQLPVSVDFSKEMLILISMGYQGSGGYSVAITSLFERAEDVVVTATETLVGPLCAGTASPTYPMVMATIPKTEKHLTFYIDKVIEEKCQRN